MYHIQLLNQIDPVVQQYLPAAQFALGTDTPHPDAILVRSAAMHDMALADSLCAVVRAGAGVNNIPIDRCSDAGIVVFNTPGANANAVKEMVVAALLLSGRRIVDAVNWANSREESGAELAALVEKAKSRFAGPELLGKRLGIIGLGAIGVQVANAAHGMGMDVTGYDPYMTLENAWGLSRAIHRAESLDEILTQSDYITVHIPYNAKTKGYIGAKQFEMLKEGAVLLNFARGELVEKDALLAALASGRLRKYVTDFPAEYLLRRDDVICLPHLGASTPESEFNCAVMASQQLADYLLNGNIVHSVNFPECHMPRSGSARLAVLHRNITNMLGQITSILARDHHNITNMLNKSRGAFAYTLIDLDDPADMTACASCIQAIEGVLRVRLL